MSRNGPKNGVWSVSAAQRLEQCLLAFKLQYVDRVPRPAKEIPLHWRRGTVVHGGLEAAFKQRQLERAVGPMMTDSVWEAAKAGIVKEWKKEEMPHPSDSEGMWDDVHVMVQATLEDHEVDWEQIIGVEKKLFVTVGMKIIGFVDLMLILRLPHPETEEPVDTLVIRDWKTTRTKKTEADLLKNFQGHTYAGMSALLGLAPPGMPVAFQHYYPPIQESVTVPVTIEQGEAAISRIRSARDVAHHETEWAPEKGSWCGGCAYKPMCPAWAVENEQQELADQIGMFG